MSTTYRAVMLMRRGGPEVLEEVTLPLVEPGPGEVRIAVRATGAGATDLTMRRGRYPFAPPIPFVPGYEVIGEVEAAGRDAGDLRVGDRVAALTVHGGYAEKLVRPAKEFVRVPPGLDDGEAVALILNYVTAYQAIHRVAGASAGDTALVTGASGGVGTAALDLLRAAGIQAYGAASAARHDLVRSLGATPIEGRAARIDRALRAVLPRGVDLALDGLGGRFVRQCIRATRRGGSVVGYGFSGATDAAGRPSTLAWWRGMIALLLGARLVARRGRFYGITLLYRRDPAPFREDLPKLFDLLGRGVIRPRIAARLPLLAARRASELLERGGVEGKIVHLAAQRA
jgi:NADPH:quinone reductase-like Zn-dependent oxidoreductase